MSAEIDTKRSRSPARNIAQLRDLPASAILMLFTPVMITPVPTRNVPPPPSSKLATDPFESLGKAFSKYHRRIRHVPYVPAVGFTETHEAFLAQADAVILVSCGGPEQQISPIKVESTNKEDEPASVLAKQAQFAHDASLALVEMGDGTERNVPMINFHFGDDQWPDQATEYLNVWAGERYSPESVKQIVELVFGDGDGGGRE